MRRRILLLLQLFCLTLGSSAGADPVQLTLGSISSGSFFFQQPGSVELFTPGLLIRFPNPDLRLEHTAAPGESLNPGIPFFLGQIVGFRVALVGTSENPAEGVIRGVTYPPDGPGLLVSNDPPLIFSGVVRLPDTHEAILNASTRVRLSGHLAIFPLTGEGFFDPAVFDEPVAATGIASLTFLRTTDNITYVFDGIRMDIDDRPVPEPATLTLLSIGLAATGYRARRRLRNSLRKDA